MRCWGGCGRPGSLRRASGEGEKYEHTLMTRRIAAFRIALDLIEKELSAGVPPEEKKKLPEQLV